MLKNWMHIKMLQSINYSARREHIVKQIENRSKVHSTELSATAWGGDRCRIISFAFSWMTNERVCHADAMERHSKIASNFICFDTLARAKALEAWEWSAALVCVPKPRWENVDWKITTDTCHLQLKSCYLILNIRNAVRWAENIFEFIFVVTENLLMFEFMTACKQTYVSVFSRDAACCHGDHPTANVVCTVDSSYSLAGPMFNASDADCAWSQFFASK